ncbi:type VI secretion system baseplate subunit TssF, partial [Serratia marcescens]|uniref:type VI secretion system baseplate subunit TssF n=1 Tax=Serratia marcescens TaxID=615 RepID=UPI0011E7D933
MAFEERYYREELDYLRQLGKLLAQEKPYLARFLADKEGDPDVERLLEAFAFLSGSLRQKLEDEFPELTHSLINMLWPNYLRPVPAMTIIEYCPPKELKTAFHIHRDELIKTKSGINTQTAIQRTLTRDGNTPLPACHFTLARDIWLQPLSVTDVRNASTLKEGIIEVDFFTEVSASSGALDLNKL